MNSSSAPSPGLSKTKRALLALAVLGFALGLWGMAWWLQGYVSPTRWVRDALRSEPVHVSAHLMLYGTLYALCRALCGRGSRWARGTPVVLTLAIALAQEMVQVKTYRRTFGGGELFDLLVDSVAIALVEWRARKRESARTQ